jgi:quercetin dioxygenase-like cupin family protein
VRVVPIDFLDLLDDDGWEPVALDPGRPQNRWSEGGPLADAPVDAAATFAGAVWHATRIDPAFGLVGVRLAPGLVVPRRHHSEDVQRIVYGGSVTVEAKAGAGAGADGEPGSPAVVGPGQFFLVEAGTPYVLTAGPEGVTFTESWPLGSAGAETTWYPGPGWVAR